MIFHSSITFGSNKIMASHKKVVLPLFTCCFFRGIYAQIMCSELIYGPCKTGPLGPRNRFRALKWAGRPSPKPVWPSQPFGLGSGGTRLLRGVGSNSKKKTSRLFYELVSRGFRIPFPFISKVIQFPFILRAKKNSAMYGRLAEIAWKKLLLKVYSS